MAKQPLDINSINASNNNTPPNAQKNAFLEKLLKLKELLITRFQKLDKKQKIISLAALSGILILIIGLILALALRHKKTSQPTKPSMQPNEQSEEITHELLNSLPKVESKLAQTSNSDLNSLIQKANILYSNGNKLEALSIFNKINTLSQSLANYNLGIMQLNQKDYDSAMKSFINAINAGEDISLASLSAALTARYMGDAKSYAYYLNQATKTLHEENKRPFYSYLYALIHYYNQNYFAVLSGINNPTSQAYVPQQAALGAKAYLVFGDNLNAIKSLEQAPKDNLDIKNLGLLYARLGDYEKAKKLLLKYEESNQKDPETKMALELIALKNSDYISAAKILDTLSKNDSMQDQAQKSYPIKVILQSRLFDVDDAQKNFIQQGLGNAGFLADRLLFYYAPFKVFDARQSLDTLKQSGIFSGYNIIASEQKILQSQTITHINQQITQALIAIHHKDLRKALKILQDSIATNPNHSILHYNIAILYAQANEYQKAYDHFLRSYYLDSKNIDSGLFAILTSRFLQKDVDRIKLDITQELDKIKTTKDQLNFFYAFLTYLNDGGVNEMSWIDKAENPLPLYYALKAAYGLQAKTYQSAHAAFEKLLQFYPDDLITLTMENLTENPVIGFKQIALKLHRMLINQVINLDTIYYGPAIAREFYVYVGFIAGTLKTQEDIIQEKLIGERTNIAGVLQLLGLLSIYQHKFDQASAIYDVLINKIKEDDSRTQFLSAVSAIGTGNYDNAALALQISKMESEDSHETRLVLGMLYQQTGNFRAAANHFNAIADKPFTSSYFDFIIDTQKIAKNMAASQSQK